MVPRQVDLNFETLVERFQNKQKYQEEMAVKAKYVYIHPIFTMSPFFTFNTCIVTVLLYYRSISVLAEV